MSSLLVSPSSTTPPGRHCDTPPVDAANGFDLCAVSLRLSEIAAIENSQEAAQQLISLLRQLTGAVGAAYHRTDVLGQLSMNAYQLADASRSDAKQVLSVLQQAGAVASTRRSVQIGHLQHDRRLVTIAAPILQHGRKGGAVSILLQTAGEPLEPFLVTLQMVAALAAHCEHRRQMAELGDAHHTALLLDLLSRASRYRDWRDTSQLLVDELARSYKFMQVAVAVRARRRGLQTLALSAASQLPPQSEVISAMEAVQQEVAAQGSIRFWPECGERAPMETEAEKKLRELTGADSIAAVPVVDERGEAVGCWLFLDRQPLAAQPAKLWLLQFLHRHSGWYLELLRRARPGRMAKSIQYLRDQVLPGRRGRAIAALIACGCMAGILAIPVPYRVGCNALIEPVTRRYVAAPYKGRLETALVAPGDRVMQGQVLAQMDGRELRWELAALTAEYHRAKRAHETNLAIHNVAAAQLAELEMKQFELKMQLLEHRLENLDIASPLDGIVITGDLKKAEGVPLTMGQTLFEIAPLNQMVAELEIPREEVANVAAGQPVRVRLEARPGTVLQGSVSRIHPRAVTRDSQFVFLAEVVLDNRDGWLRPGMNGHAKVAGPRRPLAWNLFHPSWWKFRSLVGW